MIPQLGCVANRLVVHKTGIRRVCGFQINKPSDFCHRFCLVTLEKTGRERLEGILMRDGSTMLSHTPTRFKSP